MTKREIEQMIIGAVLQSESSFGQVAHILSPHNFTVWPDVDHVKMWNVISSFYPNHPIDLVSITHSLRSLYKLYAYTLAAYMERVSDTRHLAHWALILLQIDIRDKAEIGLMKCMAKYQADNDLTGYAEVKVIVTMVGNQQADIFDVLEKATDYLTTIKLDDALAIVTEFKKNITAKIKATRKYVQIDSCFYHLNALHEISAGSRQTFINDCLAIMKHLLVIDKLPSETTALLHEYFTQINKALDGI
jgi:replicative DNA helicase